MVNPRAFRRKVLLKALGLELKGMTRKGRSAYVIVKQEFNLQGSRQSVYNQLQQIVEGEASAT